MIFSSLPYKKLPFMHYGGALRLELCSILEIAENQQGLKEHKSNVWRFIIFHAYHLHSQKRAEEERKTLDLRQIAPPNYHMLPEFFQYS